jgi:hypothetical protein
MIQEEEHFYRNAKTLLGTFCNGRLRGLLDFREDARDINQLFTVSTNCAPCNGGGCVILLYLSSVLWLNKKEDEKVSHHNISFLVFFS